MKEHVHACALCGKRKRPEEGDCMAGDPYLLWDAYTVWRSFLTPLPPVPELMSQHKQTHVKWLMTPLEAYLYTYIVYV